jgi:hypothetical protein
LGHPQTAFESRPRDHAGSDKNKLITGFFEYWRQAYQGVGRGNVTDLISQRLPKTGDADKKDLFLPTRLKVEVDLTRKRGVHLPAAYVPPKVNRKKLAKDALTVKFTVDVDEALYLFGRYGIEGSPSEPTKTMEQNLSLAIRDDVLGRGRKKGKK